MNLYSYHASYTSLTRQLERVNTELLDNRRQQLDNMQSSFNALVAELSKDQVVLETMNKTEVDGSWLYDVLHIKQRITTWSNLEKNIQNLYIYFHKTNYIVSSNAAQPAERFYKQHYQNKRISCEDYQKLLQEKSMGRYVQMPNREQDALESDVLYTVSVFSTDLFLPYATIVIEIGNDSLMSSGEEQTGRYFCILNKDRTPFLAKGTESPLVQSGLSALQENAGEAMMMTKDAALFRCASAQNQWQYAYIVDKTEFYKELRLVAYVFAATIAVCLVLGVAFAYYMTVKNHRPILRLMAQLDKTSAADGAPRGNELQYIDKRMTQLLEDTEEQSRKLVIHNLVLRDAVFSRFLQNEPLSDISMEELLESVGISFSEPYFAVVMFYIDDVKDLFFEEATEEMMADNYQLARLIISNILSDVLPPELHCAFCSLNGAFCCIVNTTRKEGSGDKIKQSLLQTQDFAWDNFGLRFMAGVSQIYEGYEGLSDCYKEAMECMEYKLLVDKGVVEYGNISETQTNLYYFPIEKEIQLINTLKSGDYEKSQQLLQHIFEVNLHQARPQIQTAKCLVYDVMGCVMKVLNDIGDLDGNNVFEQFKVFERIDRCKTVLSIQKELTDIFKKICENSMNESVEKTHRLIEGVKTFVGSYYDDPNLSCEVISDHFKMNQSYLSTMFRKYANQGLLEYIVKLRVDKAKQLLEEADMTVETAAKRVGYINTRTFTRAFKKYMGTTPGKYHEMMLHRQDRQE